MRCGFWRFSAKMAVACGYLPCVLASDPVVVNTVDGEWMPVDDARHFVFIPETPLKRLTPDISVQEKSLVYLPKQAELIVVEPQVYGAPKLSQEVTKHYTWDFIVYLGWLVAFGGVLVAK